MATKRKADQGTRRAGPVPNAVTIRLPRAAMERARELAKADRKSVSAYVRTVVLKALGFPGNAGGGLLRWLEKQAPPAK